MADYSDFQSMGTTYSFSKGPKSLYYGKGDEDLFGIVLNVPQQDEDDEWGGTERIALERISDEIGHIQEVVWDPAGGGTGLTQKVSALEAVVVTSVPEILLGTITINGSTNSITIGSDALFDATSLQLSGSGEFSIQPGGPFEYEIAHKGNSILFYDSGAFKQITLNVGSTGYIFTETSLTVPAGVSWSGDLTVSGAISATDGTFSGGVVADTISATTINAGTLVAETATICGTMRTRNVVAEATTTYNIGSAGVRYDSIFAVDLNLSGGIEAINGEFSGTLTTRNILPETTVSPTYDIGNIALGYKDVFARSLSGDPITIQNTKTENSALRIVETDPLADGSYVNLATLLGSPYTAGYMRGILIVSCQEQSDISAMQAVGIWALSFGVSGPETYMLAEAGGCSASDTVSKLCVFYDGSSNFRLRNRLGSTQTFTVTFIGSAA